MRETWKDILTDGCKAAWPICMGYLPIGLAFGVLAQKAGLQPWQSGVMSLLVFAGGSQFIAVSMLGSGASAAAIAATTLVVNLRHVLMSSSLAVHLRGVDRRFLTAFAYGVTDESFAVNMTQFRNRTWDPKRALVVNQTANAAWVLSSLLGGYSGAFIAAGDFGIDYALSAMFLALVVFQLRGRIYLLTGLAAGVAAVLLALLLPGNWYVVVASLTAACGGFLLRRYARGNTVPHG